MQRKLVVGAVHDPLEAEADRIADQVMASLANGRVQRATESGGPPPSRIAPLVSRSAAVGAEGGELDDALTGEISRSTGAPLDTATRRVMESSFGSDLGHVRVHADSPVAPRIQASAFTLGSDIHFAPGQYQPKARSGQWLLGHELTHVLQQTGPKALARHHDGEVGPVLGAGDVDVRRTIDARVQRHASWEHKMLGDVDPNELEVIALGRDLVADGTGKGLGKTLKLADGREFTGEQVLHALDQEVTRLRWFASNAPTEASDAAADELREGLVEKERAELPANKQYKKAHGVLPPGPVANSMATKWQIRLVSIALADRSNAVLTYGEVNTLPDFFGSVDEMHQTDPTKFRAFIDGIREESIRKFMRLRNEIGKGLGQKKAYDPDAEEHRVGASEGNTGTTTSGTGIKGWLVGKAVGSDAQAELKMMGEVGGGQQKAKLPGKEETSYTSGLGRNACHFAPQSWHAWGEAHTNAVAKAQEAFRLVRRVEMDELFDGTRPPTKGVLDQRQKDRAKAAELKNEALVENAFADHFLQDSFAAGHLINKTLVMQWFAKWLDAHPRKRDYTSDEKWRQVQNIAYGQTGISGKDLYTAKIGATKSNDAQTTENITKVGQGPAERPATWQDRYKNLGLELPETIRSGGTATKVFTWWQLQVAEGRLREATASQLVGVMANEGVGLSRSSVEAVLRELLKDGLVYDTSFSTSQRAEAMRGAQEIGKQSFALDEAYVPKTPGSKAKVADKDRGGSGGSGPSGPSYDDRAMKTTYADFHVFLNHAYLQLATNVLHDHFCQKGIWVESDDGTTRFKIYGDNAMLKTSSSEGVKFSAMTANMSRNAIYEAAEHSAPKPANATAEIAKRIPKKASTTSGGAAVSLADFHNEGGGLQRLCYDTIFPNDVAAVLSKSSVAASDQLAQQISKDVHQGEGF